jgi:hypothetical protein
MFKVSSQMNQELDRVGRQVLLAAASTEEEIDATAASPFLYTRLRAAIADEERRREENGSWLSMLFVARRAVPAMALTAVLAAVLTVWSMQPSTPAAGYGLEDEALTDTRDPGVEQTILSRNALSREEVFSIVVGRDEQEKK